MTGKKVHLALNSQAKRPFDIFPLSAMVVPEMETHKAATDAGLGEATPKRIVARRAPGGLLIEVAGHDFIAFRACPVGCRPAPEDLFLADLVTCAALELESYSRIHGIPVERLRLEATIDRAPDGRRRVTLTPRLPSELSEADQDALRRHIVTHCVAYAPARSDLDVEVEVKTVRESGFDDRTLVASGSHVG